MKKTYSISIIYSFAFLFFLLFTISCEDFLLGESFLEKKTSTDLTKDDIFASKVYAEQALSDVYRTLPDGIPQQDRMAWCSLDTYTDLGDDRKAAISPIYAGTINSTTHGQNMLYRWDAGGDNRSPWEGIRNGYIFIENVDRVPDMTLQEKAIRKGEAKTIIAFHYSQMLRYYGGVPWVNHAYKPDENFYNERLTVEAMVDSIVSLLDEAASVLPWSVSQNDDGRMTKAAALGLKVRVLLFAASPLFNSDEPFAQGLAADKKYVWYGNYDPVRWQRALDAGLEFLAEIEKEGTYRMVNTGNPREDFLAGYFNRYNGEVLMSSRWRSVYAKGNFAFRQLAYGVCNPTLNLVDMFPMADGSDFDWSNPEHAKYPFFKNGEYTRDVRLYETCIVNEDTYKGRLAETFVGGREYVRGNMAKNGFGFRKFVQDENNSIGKFYQWPLLRLPEIYLSIAEAYNELNKPNEAYAYVNMVRNRVELPNLKMGLSQSELREAILRERVLELAFEEVRYFDLVRFKRHDIFKSCANLKMLEIRQQGTEYSYEIKTSPSVRTISKYWKEYFLLLPLPQNEINKKYGLVQNPGW